MEPAGLGEEYGKVEVHATMATKTPVHRESVSLVAQTCSEHLVIGAAQCLRDPLAFRGCSGTIHTNRRGQSRTG